MSSQIANVKAQLEEASAQKPDTKKTFDVRERESLLKLIIGMAIGGYGLNPKAARSQITGQIATDLTINGVRLDEDTVRKYLQEAKELLPPSETE